MLLGVLSPLLMVHLAAECLHAGPRRLSIEAASCYPVSESGHRDPAKEGLLSQQLNSRCADLSHWCESSSLGAHAPHFLRSSESESRLLHLLASCLTAPSPAPGAHPGAECFPLHPLESLTACSASSSAVGSQTHQEGRNLGMSWAGTPLAGTMLRPPKGKNVFHSFLSQISSALCNTQQLRATEQRRRLSSAPRQRNSSSALSSC